MNEQVNPQDDHFLETLMRHIMKTHPRASKEECIKLFAEALGRHIELNPALREHVLKLSADEILRQLGNEFPKPN